MADFYREINACSCCYKVYRTLDKRREKMRDAARMRRRVYKNKVELGSSVDDANIGYGDSDDQVHGRGLKQEEIWTALGYGRAKGKNEPDADKAMKQKQSFEKLAAVPKRRDLREIIKEKKRQEKIEFNKKLMQQVSERSE